MQGRHQAHGVPELARGCASPPSWENPAGCRSPGPTRRTAARSRARPLGSASTTGPSMVRRHGEAHRRLASDVDRLGDGLHRDLLAVELIRRRARRVVDVVLDVDPLVDQFLAGGGPGEVGVPADQDERLAGDVHAARVVAGGVQVLLAVHARGAEALLRRAPQQRVMVGGAPWRYRDRVRPAVRQHPQRDAGLQDRGPVSGQLARPPWRAWRWLIAGSWAAAACSRAASARARRRRAAGRVASDRPGTVVGAVRSSVQRASLKIAAAVVNGCLDPVLPARSPGTGGTAGWCSSLPPPPPNWRAR